jgi:hypothetical protein
MSHNTRGPYSFPRLLDGEPVTPPAMPYFHNTDAYSFREIIFSAEQLLKPTPCTVFNNEALLYVFYGRPAYRPSNDSRSTGLFADFPVSIILGNSVVNSPRRVLPFDSGAFVAGLYEEFLHKKMKILDFELGRDASMPSKLVKKFFGSNLNYFNGQCRLDTAVGPFFMEAQSYFFLWRRSHISK